jgi:thiamine transporter
MKENSKKSVFKLTLSAVFIALSTVLSFIKIYNPPLGGGVTLFSMLPVIMISCVFGVKWGLGVSFVYALGQMFISFGEVCSWGLAPLALVMTFLIDYILAYFVLGLGGIFRKKGYVGMCIGVAFVVFLRFICHFTTGVFIFDIWCEWKNVWLYSLLYNGGYMLPEIVITTIGAVILFKLPQIKRIMTV